MALGKDGILRLGTALRLSHRMVFVLVAAGIAGACLVLVALGAYYLSSPEGAWGRTALVALVGGAPLVLLAVLASSTMRSRFRVFVQKHFLRYKYDYRHEWLRFTHALSHAVGEEEILETSIRAISDIVDSPGGVIWVLDDSRTGYVPAAATPGVVGDELPVHADEPLPRFLAQHGWIISVHEYHADPRRYDGLTLPDWLLENPEASLVIPLLLGSALIGFVVLDKGPVMPRLNFEDHDLLKTVGRDVATHISQFEANRRLAESRRFSAYHQLSAFVIHDLKNLIAQLSMVVQNAERHRQDPQFIDDSIETIISSVNRMTRLLSQLSDNPVVACLREVSVGRVLDDVLTRCVDRQPEPRLTADARDLEVLADPDRLASALEHLIRNAQDATSVHGIVTVSLTREGAWAQVSVADDGVGMDAKFVRNGLFSPFSTTKGEAGMGIGAYQAREYIRSLGGEIYVRSAPNRGTTLEVRLPTAYGPESAAGRDGAGTNRQAG